MKAKQLALLRQEAALATGAGRWHDAELLYQRILAVAANDLDARHRLAVTQLRQGRAAEALMQFARLCAEDPRHADIRTHHGLAQQAMGFNDAALGDFAQALALNPGNALTLLYRGNLLMELGRTGEALGDYENLCALAPGYDEAWFRRGAALWALGRAEDALTCYGNVLACNPRRFDALFNSGTMLLKLDRYDEARAAFAQARALAPDNPYLAGAEAAALLGSCDLSHWDECAKRLVEGVQNGAAIVPPLTFLAFCDDGDLRRRCAASFVADRVPKPDRLLWTGERYSHERLRIAYLSADFHQHATAQLIAGLIESHDRARFQVTAISFGREDASAVRGRLVRAFDDFRDVRGDTDAGVAKWLHQNQFDIAVDLKGHTEGARPGILAHRPCPVQVSYLGYPGTVGADWLDYILGDPIVLPLSHQPWYSEKIVHLPYCYQCNDHRPIAPPPSRHEEGLPEQAFVFCCFNAAWKVTPAIMDVWTRLLAAVPGSVLWLLDDNDSATAGLRRAATGRGIDPSRLVFAARKAPDLHLGRHVLADLFLDTLPYNAHTTASDALWAGLPVVTCTGKQFDGRVATSLLHTLGLDELATPSLQAYEALALALARDPARLEALRSRLGQNRLSSPLFDIRGFTSDLEKAYQIMTARARAGQPPESFSLAP